MCVACMSTQVSYLVTRVVLDCGLWKMLRKRNGLCIRFFCLNTFSTRLDLKVIDTSLLDLSGSNQTLWYSLSAFLLQLRKENHEKSHN